MQTSQGLYSLIATTTSGVRGRAGEGSARLLMTGPQSSSRAAVVRRRTAEEGRAEGMNLIGEGERVPVALQDGATHKHVDNLCADIRSESPKALGLAHGQTETRHFLKFGADTDGKMLNIHTA